MLYRDRTSIKDLNMKKLILTLMAASLCTACNSEPTEDIKIPKNLPENERPRNSDEKFEKQKDENNRDVIVSSENGEVVIATNSSGKEIIAGDMGVWIDRVSVDVELGSKGSKIAVDVNEDGEWIAAGNKGVFYNGQLVKGIRLGKENSSYAVSINNKQQWIAAGHGRVYINKTGTPGVIKNLYVVKGSQNLTAKIYDDGSWVIASDLGVWTNADANSVDDSSLQSDQAGQFRPLSASQ